MIDDSLCEDQKIIANFCDKLYDVYTSKFNKQHTLDYF